MQYQLKKKQQKVITQILLISIIKLEFKIIANMADYDINFIVIEWLKLNYVISNNQHLYTP